ncbi:MAG: DUF58 domain-containing protein [Desulfobulbaceae bacterium]|nr:DUF58 domain-containing protein [Desulfobulbaceae bacterium]
MTEPSPASPAAAGAYTKIDDLIRLRHPARELAFHRQRQAFAPLVGPHQSRFRGRGIEFEEVRAYQAGDDIRNIDWRVTARSGRPHTKLFREERERPVLILLDQGMSMFFGSRGCFKSVLAAHVAALLAWAALQQNDRVGGLVAGGNSHAVVRPRRSAHTVLKLLRDFDTFNHRLHRNRPAETTGLAHALEELRRITRPGANVFVISDFKQFDVQGEKHLHQMGRHSDVVAVRIFDPLERELPPAGCYTITDGSRNATLFTGNSRVCQRYQERFDLKTDSLRHLLGRHGVPLLQLSTRDAPLHYLKNLLGPR